MKGGNKLNWMGAPKERFLNKVIKTDTCWLWTGKKSRLKYGKILVEGKEIFAHRLSYTIFKGKLLDNLCICHTCDNPSCVNPEHLWQGTKKENSQDMTKKGRHVNNRGEKCGMAKLKWDDIEKIRSLYIPWKYGRYELAKKFKVSPSSIREILANKTWIKK